ncbi:DUF995 domain-containing protein [Microvirga sp. TS319]|uniref:DUF995 domain-containing protein n=1 Tax=Microvirga sp. TS319 TaxID=3241165 RepID=UPI00351A7592
MSKKQAKGSDDTFGRPLSAVELRQLYNGRTWLWENGGGYMDPSGRFGAIIDSWNGRMSMADGEWTANDRGRLCFRGSWRSQTGKTHSESCFTHYAWGDVIYQRKEPNGSWYVFKHSPTAESDEFNMIVPGNRIAVPISSKRPAQASGRRKRK